MIGAAGAVLLVGYDMTLLLVKVYIYDEPKTTECHRFYVNVGAICGRLVIESNFEPGGDVIDSCYFQGALRKAVHAD